MFLRSFHCTIVFLHLDLGYSEALQLVGLYAPRGASHRALHIHTQLLELREGS